MSHEIKTNDQVLLNGRRAWHGLGILVDENLSAVEAGEKCGLFWGVRKHDLLALTPGSTAARESLSMAIELNDIEAIRNAFSRYESGLDIVNSFKANVRIDQNGDRSVLGVVGDNYAVCQNRELAEFADALSQTGRVTIETCGSIRGGKRVWFLAKSDSFDMGGGDMVTPYICVSNGHDGGSAIRVSPTTVRVVCSNTLHMVIPRADGQFDKSAISIRHSGKLADKLTEAKNALRYYETTLKRNRELYDQLAETKIERQQALELFAGEYVKHWRIGTDADSNSGNIKAQRLSELRQKRMDVAAAEFLQRYDSECKKFGGQNLWLAVNAFTGYVQHDKRKSQNAESKIESNLFGLNGERSVDTLISALGA